MLITILLPWFSILSSATVTILANDDARGIVSFNSVDLVTLEEPSNDNVNTSIANLVVMRGPGMYGAVNVPFQVIPEKVENSNDLTPMLGTISFKDREVWCKNYIEDLK